MKRRAFLQSTLAGSAAALAAPTQGIPKRTYKGDVKVSMIAFGGIVVVGLEQKDAGRAVAEAFDRGVNYFDVAPSYFNGEAEMKLGPALAPYRAKSFLACKTTERGAAGRPQGAGTKPQPAEDRSLRPVSVPCRLKRCRC
jgi:aryl-alcohol dehydrogenase-like predicted oxidoreductase